MLHLAARIITRKKWKENKTLIAVAIREVSAAAELAVEVWDVGGSQNTKQLEALSKDPGKVIANSRFLGVVEIPLATTLHFNRGMPPMLLIELEYRVYAEL